MPAEKLEHRTTHEDEEDLMEWQKKNIRPFITSLNGRNSDLMSELARESMAVTGTDTEKHPTSWLDQHDQKAVHPFSANYEDRELNRSEADILLSYKATADSLDDTQQEFLSMTIVEAMSHRPNSAFTQYFPKQVEDYAVHHGHNAIPDPKSYNSMMQKAHDYYAEALQNAEVLLEKSIKKDSHDPYPITWAVDNLRVLEQDFERTAANGMLPQYLEHIDTDRELYNAYRHRGNALAESFTQDFKDAHPGIALDPGQPEYVEHFKQTSRDYLPGDVHNVADLLAFNHAIAEANRSQAGFPSQEVLNKFETLRDSIYQSLTGTQRNPKVTDPTP